MHFLEKTDLNPTVTLTSDEPAVTEAMEGRKGIETGSGTEVTEIDPRSITETASLVRNVQGVNETVASTAAERKGSE